MKMLITSNKMSRKGKNAMKRIIQLLMLSLIIVGLVMTSAHSVLANGYTSSYTFTSIDNPDAGGRGTYALGINNFGDIVGYYYFPLSGDAVNFFLYSGGSFTPIVDPDQNGPLYPQSFYPVPPNPIGINDSKDIVGYYSGGGFQYSGGSFTTIGYGFSANGINNSGSIVGLSSSPTNWIDGFLDVGGSFTSIDVPGAWATFASGINNSGSIVGYYYQGNAGPTHGFLDVGGSLTSIDAPGAGTGAWQGTFASGINDSGDIVGGYYDDSGGFHSFLYSGGSFTSIDVPGAFANQTYASGINGFGVIVGYYWDATTGEHSFIAAPTWSASVTTGQVVLGPEINLDFSQGTVTTSGQATAITILPGSLPAPPNFEIVGGTSYDITTTAIFTGNVEVCITYNPAQITVPEQDLRLLHYSGGAWTDITLLPVDTVHKMVCGQTSSFSVFTVAEPTYIPVSIDIKPGDSVSSINPKSNGKIPVAILSTKNFKAPSRVDPNSLTFGRTGDEKSLAFCSGAEDVNGDGLLDLVCHFYTQNVGFKCGDTVGTLKGKTKDGTPILGSDSVKIAPCK